ncbi:MAG: hypothetical protein ACOYOK_00185 [Pseudobdellovibrionaceae bacterium]
MKIKTQAPITVLYRCELRDTAILVGLVQFRVAIDTIAYTGTTDDKNLQYLQTINSWLENKKLPRMLIHPHLTYDQLEKVVTNPLPQWGWSDKECKVAIQLAGLPLPPEK